MEERTGRNKSTTIEQVRKKGLWEEKGRKRGRKGGKGV